MAARGGRTRLTGVVEAPAPRRTHWLRWSIVAALALLLGGRWLADTTAARLWADAVGVGGRHAAIAGLRAALWATAITAASIWCVGHVYFFYRTIGSVHVPRRLGNIEIVEAVPRRYLLLGAIVLGLIIAFASGLGAGGWWLTRGLLEQRRDLGLTEPVLGRDAAYYLFTLPWHRTLHEFATLLSGVMLAVCLLLYAGVGALRWHRRRLMVHDLARFHLAGLLAAFGLALFWGYRLEPAEYVAGIQQVPLDAVLTEVRLPVARMLSLVALLAVVLSGVWFWVPSVAMVAGAWTLLGVASLAGHYVLPPFSAAVRGPQRLAIDDLEGSIAAFERMAYGLAPRETRLAPEALDLRRLARYAPALAVVPVWDDFAVTGVLNGMARGERYERFWDVALSVYHRDGRAVPVYLGVREVDLAAVRELGETNWERLHTLPYGHARGALAVAAMAAGEDGSPLFVPDLTRPADVGPRVIETRLDDPEVFFSPTAGSFTVVAADTGRFAGVRAGGLFRRLALAWALQSPSLATSELVGPDVLVLWERSVGARLQRYAPFARFEAPYPVIAGGRLYWLASGYLASPAFPLVRPVRWHEQTVRYLRAGLVGVVEARSGRTAVYLLPDPDPLAAAWGRAAPEIVREPDQLPPELAPHVRYPVEAFGAQVGLIAAARVAGAPAGPGPTARRENAVWWVGPWADDLDARLRRLAVLDEPEAAGIAGVVQGTVVEGRLVLDVVRFAPPVEPVSAAEISQRLAETRAPTVGVMGPRRSVVLADGVLTLQSAYATGDGTPRVVDVIVQWGAAVARGGNLPEAIQNAATARSRPGDSGADWLEARRWFDRLDQARARGDWTAFGRAYEELRRLLGGGQRAR